MYLCVVLFICVFVLVSKVWNVCFIVLALNLIQIDTILLRGGEPGQFGPGSLWLRLLTKKGRLLPAPAPAPAPTIIFVNIY